MTIQLRKEGEYYKPVDKRATQLVQHCLNENFIAITDEVFDKLRYIAACHEWEVEVI